MADELSMMKQQIDLTRKEVEVNTKGYAMEFERISKAFMQMGNLLDLLYLETSVLIEMLGEKKIIDIEEFQKKLEDTAKKIEEQMKAKAEGKEPEAPAPIIEKV